MPERGANDQETIKNLFDTVMKLRKELDYALSHLDDGNMQPNSISADSINTNTLVVGDNIAMGINAAIAWDNVNGIPSQWPGTLSWQDILACINTTYIDVNGVWTPNVYTQNIVAGTAKISLALIEDIVATNIISNTFITESLTATKGYIAELTVDQLDTSDKIANYLAGDTSDVNYIKIQNQVVEFITATVASGTPLLYQTWENFPDTPCALEDYPYQIIWDNSGSSRLICGKIPFLVNTSSYVTTTNYIEYQYTDNTWVYYNTSADSVQRYVDGISVRILEANHDVYESASLTVVYFAKTREVFSPIGAIPALNRAGEPLYWLDEFHLSLNTSITEFPAYTYVYNELTKLEQTFENDGVNYIPKIVLGAGSGVVGHPDYGKGYIYKGATGLYIEYLHSVTGLSRILKLTDEGIDLTDFEAIKYSETIAVTGLPQIWVQTAEPTTAKIKDAWIDTDNYSRYDVTTLTSGTTLLVTNNEVLVASGTFTITLHTATSAGVIKKIYNIGTGIITIAGTINGVVNMRLYPNESVELITDGTNWRY